MKEAKNHDICTGGKRTTETERTAAGIAVKGKEIQHIINNHHQKKPS